MHRVAGRWADRGTRGATVPDVSTVPSVGGAPADGVPAVLRGIVDDASLVAGGPKREVGPVVDAHLDARAARHGEVLGSLVVPVSRLSEVVAELVRRRPAQPVPVTLSVDTGLGGVPKAFSLATARAALLAPATVEMPAPPDVDGLWLERVTEFVPEDVVAVVEPRRPDSGASADWLAGLRRVVDHGCRPKLRCGGGRAGAFPEVGDVARFLAVAVSSERSFTASLGLQSAARHVDTETGFTHHGWLNLLVATARAFATIPEPPPEPPAPRAAPDDGPDAPAVVVAPPVEVALGGIEDALAATDEAALAAELRALDTAAAGRLRRLFPSFGSTAPREQGSTMARLGLLGG